MKNGVHLLQKKFVGVQPFIAANKTRQNWKLNVVAEKEEHSLNDKSEKLSVLGKWKWVHLLQKKFVGVQPFIVSN